MERVCVKGYQEERRDVIIALEVFKGSRYFLTIIKHNVRCTTKYISCFLQLKLILFIAKYVLREELRKE